MCGNETSPCRRRRENRMMKSVQIQLRCGRNQGALVAPRLKCSLALMAIFVASLTAMAATGTNNPPGDLAGRIEKACAEKKIDARLNALGGVASKLSLAEIPDALKLAEGLKSLREQLALRDTVLKRWGELAPAGAFAHVSQMPEGLSKVEAIRSVAVAYARTNGPAAATAALKMKPGRARNEAISLIAETWARSDAKAALKWTNELPEGALKEMAQRSIYFVWVHSDPVAASATVRKLPPGDTRNALLMNVSANWAVSDPDAAIKWARSWPEEADRDLALVIAVESWADSDPLAAVQFASKQTSTQLKHRDCFGRVGTLDNPGPRAGIRVDRKIAGPRAARRGHRSRAEHVRLGLPGTREPMGRTPARRPGS